MVVDMNKHHEVLNNVNTVNVVPMWLLCFTSTLERYVVNSKRRATMN